MFVWNLSNQSKNSGEAARCVKKNALQAAYSVKTDCSINQTNGKILP